MGLEHGIFFMAHLGSADFTGRLCIKWSDPSHHVSEDQAVQEASGGSWHGCCKLSRHSMTCRKDQGQCSMPSRGPQILSISGVTILGVPNIAQCLTDAHVPYLHNTCCDYKLSIIIQPWPADRLHVSQRLRQSVAVLTASNHLKNRLMFWSCLKCRYLLCFLTIPTMSRLPTVHIRIYTPHLYIYTSHVCIYIY